jgi:hypothetical protein
MSTATDGTVDGQMVYNTVAKKFYYWSGSAWTAVGGVAVVAVDMTSSPDNGTEVGQLVYSTDASSTGYYYWTGAAWTALVPEPDLVTKNYTTVDSDYTVSTTDDIIKYIGSSQGELTLPDNVPVGKIYYILNETSNGDNLYLNNTNGIVTTGHSYLGASYGAILIHVGSGDYAIVSTF